MAEGSRKPTFSQYKVKAVCSGCGRKLVAKDESAMWFVNIPTVSVYGACCWHLAATQGKAVA